jgi:hypothetical protein
MLKAERKFGVKEVAIRMERHFMPNGRSGRQPQQAVTVCLLMLPVRIATQVVAPTDV